MRHIVNCVLCIIAKYILFTAV